MATWHWIIELHQRQKTDRNEMSVVVDQNPNIGLDHRAGDENGERISGDS